MAVDRGVPSAYAVICPLHGRVYLTAKQYDAEMDRPNSRWSCPAMIFEAEIIGPCGKVSEFDDENYENFEDVDFAPSAPTTGGRGRAE